MNLAGRDLAPHPSVLSPLARLHPIPPRSHTNTVPARSLARSLSLPVRRSEFERLHHLPPRCRRSHRRHERHRRSAMESEPRPGAALTKAEAATAAAATQQRPDAPRPCLGFSDAPRLRFAARRSRLHPRLYGRWCESQKRRLPLPPDRKPLASLPHEAFPRRRRRRRLLRSQKRARVAETGSVQRRPPGTGGISRGGQAEERPPVWAGPRSAWPQIKTPVPGRRAATWRQAP